MPDNLPSPHGPRPVDLFVVERLLVDPTTAHGRHERAIAALLGAFRAPTAAHEVAVPQQVLPAFDAYAAGEPVTGRRRTLGPDTASPRRRPVISTVLAAKGAVAAAALATLAAGTAAYTGTLPAALQSAAHRAIGAPEPDHTDHVDHPVQAGRSQAEAHRPDGTATGKPTDTGQPTDAAGDGPDASGAAPAGLCTAYSHGGLATTSTAYRNLAETAGGPAGIRRYCAEVTDHVNPADAHGTADPSMPAHPSGSPTDKPTGGAKPTEHPTGGTGVTPTDHPSKPTDKPTQTGGRPGPTG